MDHDFSSIFDSAMAAGYPYNHDRIANIEKTRSLLKGELFLDLLLSEVAGISDPFQIYPPQSVDGLRTIHKAIYDAEIDLVKKASLYYYILKDWPGDAAEAHLRRTLLPETFYVLIDAFYALDNLNFQDALHNLTNPLVTLNFIPKIIRTFLDNSDASTGPKLVVTFVETINRPLEIESTIKLYFKALLQVSVESAFQFQRTVTHTPQLRASLLTSLYEYCTLSDNGLQALKMANLPLDAMEEETLQNYLLESNVEAARDIFLIHQMHLGQLRSDSSQSYSTENHLLKSYLHKTKFYGLSSLGRASNVS